MNAASPALPPLSEVDLIDILSCNLCGSDQRQWLHTASHLSSIVEGTKRYDAVLCLRCGLVYLAQTLPKEILESPGKHGGSLLYGLPANLRTREKYFQKQYRRGKQALDWIEQHHGSLKGKRGLDLLAGCGGGVAAMAERGMRAEGVDPSKLLTNHGREKGLTIHQETIDQFQADQPYDVIFGVQLLNHFIDVRALLSQIATLLAPDGLLFSETQDFFHAIRRKPMRSCLHVDHPVMFNPTSLIHFFHAGGFRVEQMETDLDRRHDFGSTNHMHVISVLDASVQFQPQAADVDAARLQLLLCLSQFQADHANRFSPIGCSKRSILKKAKAMLDPLRDRLRAA